MKYLFFIILLASTSCSLFAPEFEIDNGDGIEFVWQDGLNDDPRFRLQKDVNGYYHFPLYTNSQNIQRISVRLERWGDTVYDPVNGYRHNLEWKSNLYWWLLAGDTIANITKVYFNPYAGEVQWVNYPPLINWKDALIPTVNKTSITSDTDGATSTVIAPVGKMRGDTMILSVRYPHTITRREAGSMFVDVLGIKQIRDSVVIVLD